MGASEVLLSNLLMSLNEKADKLISLLEVGKDAEHGGNDGADTSNNSLDSFQSCSSTIPSCKGGARCMGHYPETFLHLLRVAAENVGKEFRPEDHTEEEVQQLWGLWAASTVTARELVSRYL